MEKNDEKRWAIIEEVEIAENGEVVTPTVLTTVYQIKESSLKIILTPTNVHIVTSFQITDRKDKEEVLDYILKVAKEYGFEYKRSKKSWIREWSAHNTLYQWNYQKERTGSVDLNEDESFLRRFCYFFLALFERVKLKDEEVKEDVE